MKFLKQLYTRLFGVSGAAFVGKREVLLSDIYEDAGKWSVSICDAKHQNGEVLGPFNSQADAVFARDRWQSQNKSRRLVAV